MNRFAKSLLVVAGLHLAGAGLLAEKYSNWKETKYQIKESDNFLEELRDVKKTNQRFLDVPKAPIKRRRIPEEERDEMRCSYDNKTLELLAKMIYGEARGCSADEQIEIGFSALNRAKDGKKWNGETIEEAILKPWQYSCFNKGDVNRNKLNNYDDVSKSIARGILIGRFKNKTKSTHYHTQNINPKWADSVTMVRKQGKPTWKHKFYREN